MQENNNIDSSGFGSIDEDLDFMATVYGLRDGYARDAVPAEDHAAHNFASDPRNVGFLAARLVPLACDGWSALQPLVGTCGEELRCWSLGYQNGKDFLALREDGRICWWNDSVPVVLDRTIRCSVIFLSAFPLAFFIVDVLERSPLPMWSGRIVALIAVLTLFMGSATVLERLQQRLPKPTIRQWQPGDRAVPDAEVAERVGAAVQEALHRIRVAREESARAGTSRFRQALEELRSFSPGKRHSSSVPVTGWTRDSVAHRALHTRTAIR